MENARPLGISLFALLFFLNVAIYGALAALALVNPGALRAVLHALSPSGVGPEDTHQAMGRFLPVYYAAGAVGTTLLGLGFWRLWNWTRLAVLALLALSVVGLVAESVRVFRAPTAGVVTLTLFRAVLMAFVAWYLTSRSVRAAFRRDAAA